MKTNNGYTAIPSQNSQTMSSGKAKKAAGRKIAALEKQLARIDQYENSQKNVMQDRLKFMSGKNARRKDQELDDLCKRQGAIRAEIARLQEML